jgi:hypothetical protein
VGNRERRADVIRARLARGKALARLQNTADQVALAVRERIRQINATFDQIKAFDDGIKAAESYRDKVEVTISQPLGRMTPERLQLFLQAQELVANLQRSRLQAVTAYNTAVVDLARAKGTVLEMYRLDTMLPVLKEAAGGDAAESQPQPQPAGAPAEGD